VIGRAQSTQGSLNDQRTMFANIRGNLLTLGTKLPVIGNLIGAIGARKRRDVLVLGGTAGFCFVLLFWAAFM